jgi:hypothetical protein
MQRSQLRESNIADFQYPSTTDIQTTHKIGKITSPNHPGFRFASSRLIHWSPRVATGNRPSSTKERTPDVK